MPFGGLLTAGLISGIGGVGSGLLNFFGSQNASGVQQNAEQQLLALINQESPQFQQLISGATGQGIGDIQSGVSGANSILGGQYGTDLSLLAPYLQAGGQAEGQLAAGLAPGGNLTPTNLTPQQILAQDPGYQFQLQQGKLALENSAAASGSIQTGGEAKALTQYGQDFASGAYQQAFQNYNTNQNNLFQRLMGVAGQGLNATGTGVGAGNALATGAASNIMSGAGQEAGLAVGGANSQVQALLAALGIQGSAITGTANAAASGYVGGANALGGGLSSATSSLSQAEMLQLLLSGNGFGGSSNSSGSGYGG